MRILLVANTLPHTDISGVGEQVVQLAAGLEGAGHEVRILGRGDDGARGPKLLFPLAIVGPFCRELVGFRPHIVQVHESDGALVAWITRTLQSCLDPVPRLVALLQVSYLEEMRSVRPLRDGGRVLGRPGWMEYRFRWFKAPVQVALGQLTAWLAERVLSPSRQTASEIERDYGVGTVSVLPNVTGSAKGEEGRSDECRRAGYLLFVGRLRIRKGLEVLLHALRGLEPGDALPDVLVVGDGEHRPRIEGAVVRLGLQERVHLLGRVPPEEVPGLMRDALALVVPSIYEGMPLVILEAMAAAKPVIASGVSGIPEVVEDGETGWLVPPEDVAALTGALRQLLADPAEAERRGRLACERVARGASPAEAARIWEETVMASGPGSS